MPVVRINGAEIHDFTGFNNVFAKAFGFPDFYGRNMDAWIDCMSDLSEDTAMTTVRGCKSDPVVLAIDNCHELPNDVFMTLVRCAGFVNWRRIEHGEPAILVLAFDRC